MARKRIHGPGRPPKAADALEKLDRREDEGAVTGAVVGACVSGGFGGAAAAGGWHHHGRAHRWCIGGV